MSEKNLYLIFSEKKNTDTYVFGNKIECEKKYNKLDKDIYYKSEWSIDSFIWCFHCGVLKEKDRHVYKYAMLFWKAYNENHWYTRHPFPDDIKKLAKNLNIKNSKDANIFIIQEFSNMIIKDLEKLNNIDKVFKWFTCEETESSSCISRIWDEKPYKTEFGNWTCDKKEKHSEIINIYYLASVSSESDNSVDKPVLVKDLICNLENQLQVKIQELEELKGE